MIGGGEEQIPYTFPSLEAWFAGEGRVDLDPFTDSRDILPAHTAGTAYLIRRGVIKGSGVALDPGAKLSRAQAATMVLRVKGVTFTPAPPYINDLFPASGPAAGGTTIVINGAHLTGATAVTFGGTNATSFQVKSDQQITAVVPAHAAGTVDVRVTTPRGTSPQHANTAYAYGPMP